MGTPTSLYDFGYGQTWYYGSSRVSFKNGAVSGWDNVARNLRVVYPGAAPAYAQPNPGPTRTLHTGSAIAENGSYHGEPNKVGIPKTVRVRGYYRKDGTYVQGHYRSRPTGRTKKLTGSWP